MTHFTAVLIVNEVTDEHQEKITTGPGYGQEKNVTVPREVVEVAKVVVRADTLDALKEKITAHVALV